MQYDEQVQRIFEKAFQRAIAQDLTALEKLAVRAEDHYERLARGGAYFRVGETVGYRGDFSYGTIKEVRALSDTFEYLVAWFEESNPGNWEWVEEQFLSK